MSSLPMIKGSGTKVAEGTFSTTKGQTITIDTGLSSIREFVAIGKTITYNTLAILSRYTDYSQYNYEALDYNGMQTSQYYTPKIQSISGGIVTISSFTGANDCRANYKYIAIE